VRNIWRFSAVFGGQVSVSNQGSGRARWAFDNGQKMPMPWPWLYIESSNMWLNQAAAHVITIFLPICSLNLGKRNNNASNEASSAATKTL